MTHRFRGIPILTARSSRGNCLLVSSGGLHESATVRARAMLQVQSGVANDWRWPGNIRVTGGQEGRHPRGVVKHYRFGFRLDYPGDRHGFRSSPEVAAELTAFGQQQAIGHLRRLALPHLTGGTPLLGGRRR